MKMELVQFLLILAIIRHSLQDSSCTPLPSKFDILFLIDSTSGVLNEDNHRKMLEFLADFAQEIKLVDGDDDGDGAGNRLALAQFTPELKVEFNFNGLPAELSRLAGNGESEEASGLMEKRILDVPYSPCQLLECFQSTSLNNVARQIFDGQDDADFGNRFSVPDLVFLLTTPLSRPAELNPGETLMRPRAPIHFYIITIGASPATPNLFKSLEFAATTVHLGALEFADLPDLVAPLCQSVQSFLGDDPDATGPLPASFCFICLVLLTIFTLLLAGLLCWAVRKYRKEGHRYKKMAMSEQEKLQKLEDYYQKKLRYREEEDSAAQLQRTLSELPMDHPALKLPPVDVLLLVDGSGSIGNVTFEQVKTFLRKFAASIDVAPGRSRIACVIFAVEPYVYFNFNRFHSLASAQGALLKMPLMGGGTRLAKALAFASGMLAREQTMRDFGDEFHLRTIPTPRNERLQVIILVSDGTSDDNFDQQAVILNERLQIKIAAVVTKKFYRERLVPIVRYEDAIFTLAQIEALSNWIWNQQKMWNEKFAMMGEKSFFTSTEELTNTAMDNSAIMEETNARSSPKNRIKKHQND